MLSPPAARETRKDAQRNRTQILDAARQAFASDGIEVSMDAIARKAAVGPGTLYRHFASKDALLAVLLAMHHEDLDRQRAAIAAEESHSGRALERWIDALGDWMLAYDGLPGPLRAACSGKDSPLTPTCHTVIETTERILGAAQHDGFARATITGRDIFLGALAIAWTSGTAAADDTTRGTLRDVLKNGWTVTGATPDGSA